MSMFNGQGCRQPNEDEIYEDYKIYAERVVRTQPLSREDWQQKTRSTLAGVTDNRER